MNPNGDEKRIRQLFSEMSRDDQRRAPQFAEVLAAAHSGRASAQNRSRSLRFVMAAAILCTVVLIAMTIIVTPWKSHRETTPGEASAPTATQEAPVGVEPSRASVEAIDPALKKHVPKQARHRRTPDRTAIAMKSLFAWRSPTAALLKTPSDELLKSLPRLGESLQTIRAYSADQFN